MCGCGSWKERKKERLVFVLYLRVHVNVFVSTTATIPHCLLQGQVKYFL